MEEISIAFLIRALKKTVYALLTCIFALAGASIGMIAGALKGQTTETGLLHGASIGAIAGAVLSMDGLDSLIDDNFSFKITIFGSLLNGKIVRECVSPAILKAYQWQISNVETSGSSESSDIFDTSEKKGLSLEIIKKLPIFDFNGSKTEALKGDICCAVCLQDLKEGEKARRLPICKHMFHLICIDRWLVRQGSCPICRHDV